LKARGLAVSLEVLLFSLFTVIVLAAAIPILYFMVKPMYTENTFIEASLCNNALVIANVGNYEAVNIKVYAVYVDGTMSQISEAPTVLAPGEYVAVRVDGGVIRVVIVGENFGEVIVDNECASSTVGA